MARRLSNSQIKKLSEQLRSGDGPPAPADLERLGEVLLAHNEALEEVVGELRSIGLAPTSRLKTSGTIVDKLRRQPYLDLLTIQDLAGARIVRPMSFDEQDALTSQIREIWPAARFKDRRTEPSHGYRAVHVIPKLGGCSVEIQLRTIYQDVWAQVMETLGDAWGREIRYGGPPINPDAPWSDTSDTSRLEMVEIWIGVSESLYELGVVENDVARLRAQPDRTDENRARLAELEGRIDTSFKSIRDMVGDLRDTFAERGR